jgi:uncharacterized membrane protein YgcG
VNAGESERRSSSKKRRRAAKAMPKWMALLMVAAIGAAFLFGAGMIFWTQAPVAVRCQRVSRDRVDVTVERRVLGFHTISTEIVPDVINAFGIRVAGSKKSRGGSSFSQNALMLNPRQGAQRRASGVSSQLTRPKAMARQIDEFINASSERSLTLWYVPWLLHLLALPFLFVALLMLFVLGKGLLLTLGFIKPESLPVE